MSLQDREKIHYELLEALYVARKQVETLEAALAHNAAFLGTGIEREGGAQSPGSPFAAMPGALMRYLELVEPEEDISNFIGSEGDEASRPRLGKDAPYEVRPNKEPEVSPLVGQLAFGHPADAITFTYPPTQADKPAGSPPAPAGTLSHPVKPAGKKELFAEAQARMGRPLSGTEDAPAAALNVQTEDSGERTASGIPDCERSCSILRAFNDGLWEWDLQTGELFKSRRWESLVGKDGEAGGSPIDVLIGKLWPLDAVSLRQRFFQLQEGRVDQLNCIVRFRRGNGWGWGILRAAALRRYGKKPRLITLLADMTIRQESEIALYAGNGIVPAMPNDSPDVITRFDKELRFIDVSPTICRYFIVNVQEMRGQRLADFDITGARDFFVNNVQHVFTTAQPAQAEIMLESPLAGKFLADCRFWPEFDVDGKVLSVAVLVRDISFSQRLARNYYALFNRMEDGFILFEYVQGWEGGSPAYGPEEFALVVLNPAFKRMFKIDPPDIGGLRLSEILGDEAELWAACLRRVLLEELPVHQELHVSSGDYEISAYSPEEGRVACIIKNITELQKIEREIRLNESRLAALHRLSHMDAAPEEQVIRYSLEQAVKLTGSAFGYLHVGGRTESESGRIYWSQGMVSQERVMSTEKIIQLPWTEGDGHREVWHSEVVNAAKGSFSDAIGADIAVERYTITPVLDDGKIACLVGVANKKEPYTSSDLRQLDLFINGMWFHLRRRWGVQALRKAKEEAEAASRAKNEFLANVSHELRTPLNGILGMLQVLQQSALTPEQMECVVTANLSGRSLLRIISDILDFSRIEAGRFELEPHLFDFAATVRSTLGMFTHQARQKNIEFSLSLDPDIPGLLLGDDARVRQIIFNLVGNAFKFTSQGEISVDCSLLPRCRKGYTCIYLAVRDTGIGIPEGRLEDIFRAFTQIDSSSTRRYAGTGLGLSIAQRLIHMMHGAITVESFPGEGTTIHCSLAFEVPEENANVGTVTEPAAPEASPLRLLVVEDDPVSQFTLRALLKKGGYQCTCVSDGKQALEVLMLQSFDCIITDIQMPVMDGMELTQRIRGEDTAGIEASAKTYALLGLEPGAPVRSIPRDIPIIALTAYAMSGDRERFLNMGVDYYLAKPVTAVELYALLSHVATLQYARQGG